MSQAGVIIRECVSIDDFQQCIELERAVWKDSDLGIMPIRLYLISKACNAPTIGAFDPDGRLVGFVHTMLALMDGRVVYHSHLAAVLEDLRHKDIGFRMKLAQRQRALEAGIPLIIWTFDPLQSRNAYLNLKKLGAIIRRYEPNYYGEGLSTVFGQGVPSDRLFAEWWISSPYVVSLLAGKKQEMGEVHATVVIPEDVNAIAAASVEDHLRWRLIVREELMRELSGGLIIRGIDRHPERSESVYLLGEDDPQFSFERYSVPSAGKKD
jgi:predicted GNAT superfamily acetyltransferase